MNTLKNIAKKAIAIGTGAVMTAATIAGAAADLSEYPAPFVQNGVFNGLIVVGERAATADVLGSIEIASSLQAASTTVVSDGGAGSVSVTGDAKKIGDSADMLELGEAIADVTETLTDDELEFLRGGVISTDSGDTDFTQIIKLDGVTANVQLFENEDDETGVFLRFEDDTTLFTYELEFTSGLESDVDTNGVLVDLEDESLFILGQYFNIINAESDGANEVMLEMMAGDVTDTLSEGDTKTYTIDGKEYEVTILFVSDTDTGSAKFLVNGETTDSLASGDTDKVAGIELGVREVLSQSRGTTGGTLVEFYVGANKMEFTDSNTASSAGGSVDINGERIEDANLQISGTIGTTEATITRISYNLSADVIGSGDIYLSEGEGMRQYLDEPEGMIADNWDIVYMGHTMPETTDIEFNAVQDDEYELTFTNRRGDTFTVPLLQYDVSGNAEWGTADDESLWFYEINVGGNASDAPQDTNEYLFQPDDYLVLTDTDGTLVDNGDDTYVLQWTDVEEDEDTLVFENVANGQEIKARWDNPTATGTANDPFTGDITIGGKDFEFWFANNATNGLAVDLDNDGVWGNNGNADPVIAPIVVRGGGILYLANATADMTTTGLVVDDVDMYLETDSDDLDEGSNVFISWSVQDDDVALELDISNLGGTSDFNDQPVDDEDRTLGLNRYGTMLELTTETGEANSLVISYPQEQVEALVYVTGGDVQTTTVESGAGVRVNPIEVGSAVLDSDVEVGDANMIVVGGPCANTAAAALLGNPEVCGEGFVAGKGIIKYIDGAAAGGKVAILVAGYEALETQGAARVLAQYDRYDLDGEEVEVSVTTLSQSGISVN